MRSEFREIEVFIAKDGAIFTDEDRCHEYELSIDWDLAVQESPYFTGHGLNITTGRELQDFIDQNKSLIREHICV